MFSQNFACGSEMWSTQRLLFLRPPHWIELSSVECGSARLQRFSFWMNGISSTRHPAHPCSPERWWSNGCVCVCVTWYGSEVITIDDEVIDVDTCNSHTSESTTSTMDTVSVDWTSVPSATVTRGLTVILLRCQTTGWCEKQAIGYC